MNKSERYLPDDKFPYFYMIILFIASLTSALPLTGLYPYVALMVVEFNAAPDIDHAGYYSGFIVSAFMFGRLLTSYYWGSMADKIGRKPIVTISCLSICLLSIVFGMSVNVWMAILSRLFLGLLNPLNSVIKTMSSEICSRQYQPLAMSIGVGAWSVGLVIGPSVGGIFAQPAERFPNSFLNNSLFRLFPFLLPNLVTSLLALISLILVYFYLPETFSGKKIPVPVVEKDIENSNEIHTADMMVMEDIHLSDHNNKDENNNNVNNTTNTTTTNNNNNLGIKYYLKLQIVWFLKLFQFSGVWNLLKRKKVFYTCLGYCLVSLTSIIFDEVLVLFAMASPESNGLGFSHLRVGYSTSITGFPMMFATFVITPYLNKKYSASICFRYGQLCGSLFSILVLFLPIIYHQYQNAVVVIFILIATGGKCSAVVTFSSIFLLINDSVDSDERGAVNGLSVTLAGVSKALGPMIGSILFAWSISNGLSFPLNYAFVFLLNAIIGISTFFLKFQEDNEENMFEEQRLVSPQQNEQSNYDNQNEINQGNNKSNLISNGIQLMRRKRLRTLSSELEKNEGKDQYSQVVNGNSIINTSNNKNIGENDNYGDNCNYNYNYDDDDDEEDENENDKGLLLNGILRSDEIVPDLSNHHKYKGLKGNK